MTCSTEGLVKRAKVNELARDYSRFAGGILHQILKQRTGKTARVFISKHFPERMVDRNFAKREDRLYMFKLLSYVFEKHGEDLFKDQDVFVKHNDVAVMIFSEFRNDIQQIRLNTFINNHDSMWTKSKNGRPVTHIDIGTGELMSYTPCTLKDKKVTH